MKRSSLVRAALLFSYAALAAACSGGPGEEPLSSAAAVTGASRGLLANPGLDGQPLKGVFYFPGDWENNPPAQFYGGLPAQNGGNANTYTLHPADARHLGFSESTADQTFAVQQIAATGANTIVMSYWGPPGTDNWSRWAPMEDAPQAHQQLFAAVAGTSLVILPSIEDSATTECGAGGHSPGFRLADDFPQGANWIIDHAPVNPLLAWITDLVERFIVSPADPRWPSHFARMYDSAGTPRYVIQLKDVSSTQSGVTDASFAQGFADLAQGVKALTGVDVGFVIDPLEQKLHALPADSCGIHPADTSYVASANATGPLLGARPEVIAIQAYRSEITAAVPSYQYAAMTAHKRAYFESWGRWLPVIGDVSAGYDSRILFQNPNIYGHDDTWRNDQSQLRSGHLKGLVFTAWNGFTEGWAGMPTLERGVDGTDPGAMNRWLTAMFSVDPQQCNHVHFVNGQPTYYVYGAICAKYYQTQGLYGPLGAPTSSEHASVTAGSRRNDFQYGSILWRSTPQAYEVHGLIGQLYASMGYEGSWLGMPTSDTLAWGACANGQYNQFEHGKIVWCPGGQAVATP
ncbi:MAG TPA: hypothetical protein VGI39_28435 [Polyangiaceae bacterium]|jgi:hypothetical protein